MLMQDYLRRLCIVVLLILTATATWGGTKARQLTDQASALYKADRLSDALDMYISALKTAVEEDDKQSQMICYCDIGIIYDAFGDYLTSTDSFLRAYEVAAGMGDVSAQANLLPNIVVGFCRLGDMENAHRYYEMEKRNVSREKYDYWQYYVYYNEARICTAEKNYEQAIAAHRRAEDYARRRGMDDHYLLYQQSEIGNIYVKTGHYDEAIALGHRCEDEARRLGSGELLVNAYKMLTDAYAMTGRQSQADRYRELYVALNDSVYNQRKFNDARFHHAQLEDRLKTAHIEELDHRLSRGAWLTISVSVLLAVLGVFSIVIARKNRHLRQAQMLLIEKNRQLAEQSQRQREMLGSYLNGTDAQTEDMEQPADATRQATMTPDAATLLLKRILSVMSDPNIISNPDFNQQTLATMVKSNTSYVSWVINETYGKNFKTLLNEYRINEACRRLTDTDHFGHFTIQAIYESVGYNNANSFIRAFKRVCGMTPSVYQQLARQNE